MTARSNATKRNDPGFLVSASSIAVVSWLVSLRATATTRYPACVSLRTMPKPKPRLPPVTMTLRIVTCHLTCRRDIQSRHKIQHRRHLVPRERFAANLQDLVLQFGSVEAGRIVVVLQNDIGND